MERRVPYQNRKRILVLSFLLTVLLCGCAVLVGILMYLKVSGNTSLVAARPSPDTDAVVPSAAAEVPVPDAEGESKDSKEELEDAGVTVEKVSDYTLIRKPVRSGNATTWDCIWFGNYWQDDTNGDGHCFERDTTVTKHEEDDVVNWREYYTDQDGKELYGFEGEETTYYADAKQPIKWRVLDVDADGNALLLADKLIDIVEYTENWTDVTWENCTMRSYLNGYPASQNICGKDFSETSGNRNFLYSAFNDSEINCLIKGEVKNPNNPVYGTAGGNTTYDRLFCLSLEEAINGDYGFIKNDFTNPSEAEKQWYTDDDPTRVAVTTKFTEDKPGYDGDVAGMSAWWWLRSPGYFNGSYTSAVSPDGEVFADLSDLVHIYGFCFRPAFRMNLSSSSSLWSYAGTVCSDGTVIEEKPDSDPDL